MKAVVEYFRETYGFVIQHTQLPCLQVGNTQRPNYLPMEVGVFYLSHNLLFSKYLVYFMCLHISSPGLQDCGGAEVLQTLE